MKRIVMTGGGSAGHVTANLALIPHLQRNGFEVHYIGTETGIERGLVEPVADVTYHSVQSGKLRRYFDWKNFTDPFRVIAGTAQAASLIGKLQPNVIFAKGGFVSVPVVMGGSLRRVPTILHESDYTPGLANKLCTPFAQRICVTFPETLAFLPKGKAVFTGTPLRPELFTGSRERGLRVLGFSGSRPVLMMMGGSLGAVSVNTALREALPELEGFDVVHICGKGNLDPSIAAPHYRQFEYVNEELPHVFAAADVVLSRAGSNSINELLALKKPCLFVPYPKTASRGDQILNAESFERRGISRTLLQENMTPHTLADALKGVYDDRRVLCANMEKQPSADGTQAVLKLILESAKA